MKISELNIKELSEKGKPMNLRLPDGQTIENAFVVIGADSETFAGEVALARRKEVELLELREKLPPPEYAKRQKTIREEMLSSLVVEWSFEDPFSRPAVQTLFVNAPYVLEQVDNFASIRENFFIKPSMG